LERAAIGEDIAAEGPGPQGVQFYRRAVRRDAKGDGHGCDLLSFLDGISIAQISGQVKGFVMNVPLPS
jgi:hypothetical protein